VSAPLVCPGCAAHHAQDERFCGDCGLPLVHPPDVSLPPESELRERARKIHPSYAEGPLTRVATARHQAEAELLQGLLLEEGIPSLVRRSGGFDVPDFLAAGPRDIVVAASGAEAAREILGVGPIVARSAPSPPWVRVLAFVLALVVVVIIATFVIGAALS
jgi:Putative prokaryotic signal transducing protein